MRIRSGLFLLFLAFAACSGGETTDTTDGSTTTAGASTTSTAATTTTTLPPTATLSGTITGLPPGDVTCDLVIQAFDLVVDVPVWEAELPCGSATPAGLDYSIDVAPGEYSLRILARWGAGPPTLQNYVWYPGTQDHAAATVLTLEAGSERAWSAALSSNLGTLEGDIVDALSGFEFGGTTPVGPDVLCAALFETNGFFTGMWIDVGAAPTYRFDGVPAGSYQALFYDCDDDGSPLGPDQPLDDPNPEPGPNPLVVDRWLGAEPFGDVGLTGLMTANYTANPNDRAGAATLSVPAGGTTAAEVRMHTVPTCLVQDVTMIGTRGEDTFPFTEGVDVVITMGGDASPVGLGSEDYLCNGAVEDPVETPVIDYCVQGGVFLRHGGATRHTDFGYLEDYEVVTGAGQVWIDPQNRPWYQIEWSEPGDPEYGWFAGWFAVETPCPIPTWTLRNDGFGQAEVGDPKDEVLEWLERAIGPYDGDFEPLDPDACVQWWYTWPDLGFAVAFHAVDDTFHSYNSRLSGPDWLELSTAEGIMSTSSVADMLAAYPGATLESGLFLDEWYVADVDGDHSLRFYQDFTGTTVITVSGGEFFYCTP